MLLWQIISRVSYWGCRAVRSCVVSSHKRFSSAGIRATAALLKRSTARVTARGTRAGWTPEWAPPLRAWWTGRRGPRQRRLRPLPRSDGATTRPGWAAAEEAGRPGSSCWRRARPVEPGAARCWCCGGGNRRSPGTAGGPGPRSSAGWGSAPGVGSQGSGADTWWGPCPAADNSRTSLQVRELPQHSADPACFSDHSTAHLGR